MAEAQSLTGKICWCCSAEFTNATSSCVIRLEEIDYPFTAHLLHTHLLPVSYVSASPFPFLAAVLWSVGCSYCVQEADGSNGSSQGQSRNRAALTEQRNNWSIHNLYFHPSISYNWNIKTNLSSIHYVMNRCYVFPGAFFGGSIDRLTSWRATRLLHNTITQFFLPLNLTSICLNGALWTASFFSN